MAKANTAIPEPITDSDTIAARAALLGFYGSYSMTFATQFVASVFGLITACALINASLVYIVEKNLTIYYPPFMTFSGIIFVIFIAAAYYTYKRLSYYSDLASNLVSLPTCLMSAAKVDEIILKQQVANTKKRIRELELTFQEISEELPPDYKAQIEAHEGFCTSFRIYEKMSRHKQDRKIVKRILNDNKKLYVVMTIGVIALFLVTYYPILISL